MANFERSEGEQPQRFVVPIAEYQSPASRIRGFQELFEFDLHTPTPILVLGDTAFRSYVAKGELQREAEKHIRTAFQTIRRENPTRGAYIGRAFYVPGIDNPNGPRTAAIWDEDEFANEVKTFYQFVIDHGYHQSKGSDIALVFHPFIHAMDKREFYGNRPIAERKFLPWTAGYVVPNPVPGRERQVRIVATFGPDEAVQSVPSDQYDVDIEDQTITEKRIAIKHETIVPRTGSVYEPYTIPLPFQQKQALTDIEALQVAEEAWKVIEKQSSRVEFIMQPDGIYVREIAPWQPIDERAMVKLTPNEEVTSPIIRIINEADIERIPEGTAIVYMGPETFQRRTTDLFALVANKKDTRLVVLVRGTHETSHQTRILTDASNVTVKLVGDAEFADGDIVRIRCDTERLLHVEYLNPYDHAIIALADIQRLAKGEAGQKVARLAIMQHHGLPVPDGFALSSKAIQWYFRDLGLNEYIGLLDTIDIKDVRELTWATDIIQKKILTSPLPFSLEQQIARAIEEYGFDAYAIRSSGSEDGETESRAGLYKSVMNVAPTDVTNKLRETIASYFSPASIQILRSAGQFPSRMTVGVGIHEYIPETTETVGAVVFSSKNSILITATKGSPEGVVSGMKDYVRIAFSRNSGDWSIEPIGQPDIAMSEDEIHRILEVTKRIEQIFQSYQDIELLSTPDQIYIVQARPL